MKPVIVAVSIPGSPKIKVNYAEIYALATTIFHEIRKRTLSGRDYTDTKFHAYSDTYAAHKTSIMSKIPNAEPEKVTLMASSGMIRSIKIRRNGTIAEGYFVRPDKAKLGYWHQTGAGRLPVREWLTISTRQKNFVRYKIRRLLGIGV